MTMTISADPWLIPDWHVRKPISGVLAVVRGLIAVALRPTSVADKLIEMARRIDQIHEDILALSTSEKEALLRSLWEDLDGPADSGADVAWLEEARRRDHEIDAGLVPSVPADEVLKRLEASLKK